MPTYRLVGGPCNGQTLELKLDDLGRMNWLVDVPATQDIQVSIWGMDTGVTYSLPVRATYRLVGGANSVTLEFVRSVSANICDFGVCT